MKGNVLIDTSAWIEFFSVIAVVDPHPESYRLAGQFGYSLAKKGHTMGLVDLLIAQLAIENGLRLLTLDNHFEVIQKYSLIDLVAL